jgi:HSP20 family protein
MKSLFPWSRETTPSRTDEPNPVFTLHRQMDRLFDDFFRDFDAPSRRTGGAGWPTLDVSDGDKEMKVVAELPGLDEKDIDITLHDGVLTLKGEKRHENHGSVYSERWHGQFSRQIHVGPDIDPDKVKASFDKGLLTVTLQKRPEAQSQVKRIAINRT